MRPLSPGPPALLPNKNFNQSASEYECAHRLEIADCQAASSAIDDDRQNNSDAEDISHPPVCGRPPSQDSISCAGRALSNVDGYTYLSRAIRYNPWNSFSSEDNFNLASWLVWSKIVNSEIGAYCAEGLGGTDSRSLQSACTMRQHLEVLDPSGE